MQTEIIRQPLIDAPETHSFSLDDHVEHIALVSFTRTYCERIRQSDHTTHPSLASVYIDHIEFMLRLVITLRNYRGRIMKSGNVCPHSNEHFF